jgi:hypothetical protein
MRTFKVYKKVGEDLKSVKVGVSFPAFFLEWIWMFYKGLITHGFVFLYLMWLYNAKSAGIDVPYEEYTNQHIIAEIVGWSTIFVALFKGNEWVSNKYEKEGYKLVKAIQADNAKAAIALVENDNITN